MVSATAISDRELSSGARRMGFLSSNCDACGAAGRVGPRIDPHAPADSPVDLACVDCDGTGRWWFPAIRLLGTFTAHLTDAQLRAQLWSGFGEDGVRGNQG